MSCTPILLDDKLASDIKRAVINAIKETFNVPVEAGKVEYGQGAASLGGDMSGTIGIVQEHLDGTLMLCMGFDILSEILPHVLGKNIKITYEIAVDAVAEITNMVFGQVKTELNQRNHKVKLGVPCVVTGNNNFVSHFHRGRYMIVSFYIGEKMFQTYVTLHGDAASG
ncbi:MAG: chemotaxis protein CheX [Alphaproteobacteria bacterium]|nr:chemotaxis protein CheX [Alphaproteobacteria bacterium]MCL2505622.1 chemotaxis protein CheX [Alphaproteobacteria bacterium]